MPQNPHENLKRIQIKVQYKNSVFVVTASVAFLLLRGLKFYDYVIRKMRIGEFIPRELKRYAVYLEGRDFVYVYIPRARDKNRRLHRLIPPFLLPYKHYPTEEVASVVCNECGQCSSASENTIRRWKAWWKANWKEFKRKALERERRERKKSQLCDATEMTLAYILQKVLPPFWLGTIMGEFTSEGLVAMVHRVRRIVPI